MPVTGQARRPGSPATGRPTPASYVGVESAMPAVPGMEPPLEALCVAPFGMKEGMLDSGFAPGAVWRSVESCPARFAPTVFCA
jgi:hypothetical protein